jgi:hypothetical protein
MVMPLDNSHIQLDRVAFYGRTLSEYLKIFDLDLPSWRGCSILDCPAGASSFVAEAHRQGIQAVACDPLYGSDVTRLIERGEADIQHVIERIARVRHLFQWNFYSSLRALQDHRMLALRQFQEDYPRGLLEHRYINAELPRLPFEDRRFDLVLSGHFLFTYSDRFDYAFHRATILELVRVSAREVRIYPLQGPDAHPYEDLDNLRFDVRRMGFHSEIHPVPFEFQRGSNQMLRVSR